MKNKIQCTICGYQDREICGCYKALNQFQYLLNEVNDCFSIPKSLIQHQLHQLPVGNKNVLPKAKVKQNPGIVK